MAVFVYRRIGIQADFLTEKIYVLLFAGKEGPTRPDVELFHVAPQHLRGIVLGIDADGIKENIGAYPTPKLLLHLH